VRRKYRGGATIAGLAREYGVSTRGVSGVLHGTVYPEWQPTRKAWVRPRGRPPRRQPSGAAGKPQE
jgi:hypothetical protein